MFVWGWVVGQVGPPWKVGPLGNCPACPFGKMALLLASDLFYYSLSLLHTATSPYTDKKQNFKWQPDQVYL